MKKQREANFELLRIVAMCMIVVLHFMFKGKILVSVWEDNCGKNLFLWFITAFALCAVNCYVLISGYFAIEAQFKIKRAVDLIIQVLEYSLVITAVCLITGIISFKDISVYDWINYVLPLGTEEYWFISAYIIVYLFSPVLAIGIKSIDQKMLKGIIIILVLLLSVEKTILPMKLATDRMGYDCVWFIVLYLIAGYIRLYGIKWLEGHKYRSWGLFTGSCVLTWIFISGFGILFGITGAESFRRLSEIGVDYNFFFVLSASIGLFYAFKNMQLKKGGFVSNTALSLGGLTLGVYLWHEHPLIRERWVDWAGLSAALPMWVILVKLLICVLVIMTIGILIEWIRLFLHKRIANAKSK